MLLLVVPGGDSVNLRWVLFGYLVLLSPFFSREDCTVVSLLVWFVLTSPHHSINFFLTFSISAYTFTISSSAKRVIPATFLSLAFTLKPVAATCHKETNGMTIGRSVQVLWSNLQWWSLLQECLRHWYYCDMVSFGHSVKHQNGLFLFVVTLPKGPQASNATVFTVVGVFPNIILLI